MRPLHPVRRADRRRPADRAVRARPAAADRDRRRRCRSTPTSPATPCRSARWARSPAPPTGSVRGRSTWCPPERLRALRVGLPAAHRPPARRGHPAAGGQRPAGQRGVELRQGPVGFHLRHPAGPADRPAGPRCQTACSSRRPGRRRSRRRPRGLLAARGRAGVLTGGRLTLEDAYAYAKFARLALATNDIDMRARPHSAEETEFLAASVAGRGVERELRRPGARARGAAGRVRARGRVADRVPAAAQGRARGHPDRLLAGPAGQPWPGPAVRGPAAHGARYRGRRARPPDHGSRPGRRARPPDHRIGRQRSAIAAAEALTQDGAIILAGERLAEVPGALTAADRLARATGARLAWVPRRAGERGAIEAGALPSLLPGGRPVADAQARAEVARYWGVAGLPASPGRDTSQILAATSADIDALRRRPAWTPATWLTRRPPWRRWRQRRFVVSLELRASAVTDRADVVLPVAAVAEKAGTFVNWEGRPGSFGAALEVPGVQSDLHVLGRLADEMDVHLGLPDAAAARRELAALGLLAGRPATRAERAVGTRGTASTCPSPVRARRCWPPGTSFWTPAGCRTGSRSWPERPAPR